MFEQTNQFYHGFNGYSDMMCRGTRPTKSLSFSERLLTRPNAFEDQENRS